MSYGVGWGCFSPLSQSLSQPGGGSTTISVVKMCSCFKMSGDIPPCFGVFILLFIFNTFSFNQGIVLWSNKVRFYLLQMQNSGWFRDREDEKLTGNRNLHIIVFWHLNQPGATVFWLVNKLNKVADNHERSIPISYKRLVTIVVVLQQGLRQDSCYRWTHRQG